MGDLVLAAPAIAALRRKLGEFTLLCHPLNLGLARHLYPGLDARPILLPHLDKDRALGDDAIHAAAATLGTSFDYLIALRWDTYVQQLLNETRLGHCSPGPMPLDVHVAIEHRRTVVRFTGDYDLFSSYRYIHDGGDAGAIRSVRRVGLCVSAGFHLNAWPLIHWLDLAVRLHKRNLGIVLIGGPAEMVRLQVLSDELARLLGHRPRCLVGGSDFGGFLRSVADAVDVVIATDSGTAHLLSLVRPILSLFGGSPWRRFAPLGRHNAVLTREYHCSPCCQFRHHVANTCHTQECLVNLFPAQVERCFVAYLEEAHLAGGTWIDGVWLGQGLLPDGSSPQQLQSADRIAAPASSA
jgi:heptosyltransferase-2